MIYLGINARFINILLAISFIIVGAGIFIGFIEMISDDKK